MARDFMKSLMNLGRALASAPMPQVTELAGTVSGGTGKIIKDETYFAVTVNQLNLAKGREWWTEYDPLVYACVDFLYDGKEISVPKLVGPAALRASIPDGKPLPHGFLVNDIRIGAAVPFRGKPVGITMVLYKVSSKNNARLVLQVAESLSAALGLTAMTDVAKVGDVVLDGLQTLFSMKEVEPVLGQRIELAPDILKGLPERQVALINGSSVSGQGLKLQSNRLLDANGAQYSAADFLVYSLGGLPSVEAESVLPFDAEANKMYETASAGDDTSWQRAKAELITLYRRLRASPDLTTADAERLFEVYRAQLLKIKKIIENTTLLGDEKDLKDFISRSSNAAENTVLNTRANQVFEL